MIGLAVGTNNVFDSDARLQVILNKSGANVEQNIWLVEGLFYWMKKGYLDKGVIVTDLQGSTETSHKGPVRRADVKYGLEVTTLPYRS